MNEVYQTNLEIGKNQEIENALRGYITEEEVLAKFIAKESAEVGAKKYPPTDYFGGIKLSKKETYNVPGLKEKLKRTGHRRATNPTYENSLVMTQNGRKKYITHQETFYTDKDLFSNGKQKFPVENIEWRIRKILNDDRKRLGLKEMPKNQKVRDYGKDGTIRDMNGYIIVAADESHFPRGTLIMTTLGPGRVYDVGSKVHKNHIDLFTNWQV